MDLTRTVVVAAVDPSIDLERVLRRLRRERSDAKDVVVVTDRNLRLPSSLARHVRVLRHRGPQAAMEAVAELAAAGAHVFGAGRPTSRPESIGACYIVKDEEEVLEASLLAVAPFVDEIVVYDTGSSDRTVEIARACGARVVEGYWDDHFGRARDRAMAHLGSEWMFTLDADEVVEGDPAELRRQLGLGRFDVMMVPVVSTSWSGADEGSTSISPRLSRRSRVRWEGGLHEHLVPHPGTPELLQSPGPAPVRLVHSGYQMNVVSEKEKPSRNLKIAERAWLDASEDDPEFYETLSNYGRSLHVAGRNDEAIAVMDRLRFVEDSAMLVLTPGRLCTEILLDRGRADEAEEWVAALERNRESGRAVALYRARVALARGDLVVARGHVERATAPRWEGSGPADEDPWGLAFKRSDALAVSAWIFLAESRPDQALQQLQEQVQTDPAGTSVAQLLTALERTGSSWVPVLARSPKSFLNSSLRAVMKVEPATSGLKWCQAYLEAWPEERGPLVAGCLIASRCDLETALTWSVMAREAGLPELCPVRRRAEQEEQATADRALLWALLADSFGEEDALVGFHATVTEMPDEDVPRLTSAMADLTPDLAHALFGAPTVS